MPEGVLLRLLLLRLLLPLLLRLLLHEKHLLLMLHQLLLLEGRQRRAAHHAGHVRLHRWLLRHAGRSEGISLRVRNGHARHLGPRRACDLEPLRNVVHAVRELLLLLLLLLPLGSELLLQKVLLLLVLLLLLLLERSLSRLLLGRRRCRRRTVRATSRLSPLGFSSRLGLRLGLGSLLPLTVALRLQLAHVLAVRDLRDLLRREHHVARVRCAGRARTGRDY